MAYSFEFVPDVGRGIIEIRLTGFFALDAVPNIAAGMFDALRRLRCEPNKHMTLVDVTGCQIQSQPIVEAFQGLVADPKLRSRRLAFVTGSSMIKMQLRRIITDPSYAQIFADHPSALAWLRGRHCGYHLHAMAISESTLTIDATQT